MSSVYSWSTLGNLHITMDSSTCLTRPLSTLQYIIVPQSWNSDPSLQASKNCGEILLSMTIKDEDDANELFSPEVEWGLIHVNTKLL